MPVLMDIDTDVEFDTDGLTDECPHIPKKGLVHAEDCFQCPYYKGYDGFTVHCGWFNALYMRQLQGNGTIDF